VLAAFVVGAGLVGAVATEAGAQTSGSGLNVGSIQSTVDPAVAIVNTTLAGGQGQAAGTGMVIGSSGEILTNNHVIENASSVRVQIGGANSSGITRLGLTLRACWRKTQSGSLPLPSTRNLPQPEGAEVRKQRLD